MLILALDIATITGGCDGPAGGPPRLWSWYLADGGASRPQRLLHLRRFLCSYFQTVPCEGVVYEAPMPLGFLVDKTDHRVMMSEANIAFARGAIGIVEMTAEEYKKPIEGLSVQDAREAVLGWRTNKKTSGEKTKDRVMREVAGLHRVACENDNEADAWVLWQYACIKANPRLAIALTPLFGGPMR